MSATASLRPDMAVDELVLDVAVVLDAQVIVEVEVMVPRCGHEADRTTRETARDQRRNCCGSIR
jgi:hypothetical protein